MSNTHTHSTIDFQLEQALRACIEYCKEFGSAFACWKNPKQDTIRLLLDFNGAQRQEKLNLETSKTGFIISAFDKNDDTLFLENHLAILFCLVLKIYYRYFDNIFNGLKSHCS